MSVNSGYNHEASRVVHSRTALYNYKYVSASQTFTEAQLARGNLLAMEQFQIGTIQDTASQCSERGPRSALKPRAQTTVTRTKYFISMPFTT